MHYDQKNLEHTTSIFSESASDHETSSTSDELSDSEPTTSKLKSSDDVSVKCAVHVAWLSLSLPLYLVIDCPQCSYVYTYFPTWL